MGRGVGDPYPRCPPGVRPRGPPRVRARDVDVYLSAVGNPFPPYVDPEPEEPLLQTWQIYGVVGILLALAGYMYLWRIIDE